MKLKEKIENWYQGEYIPPPKNDPNSPIFFASLGHYEKSTTAKIAEFHLKHWKTLLAVYVTILLAIFAALVSLFIYLDPLNQKENTRNENTEKKQPKKIHNNPIKQVREPEKLKI